jgi:hypothetical protein
MRYADMSSGLSADLQDPSRINASELSQKWVASNDARGYVVLGDPAVKIPFARPGEKAQKRPALDTVSAPAAPKGKESVSKKNAVDAALVFPDKGQCPWRALRRRLA